MLGNIDLVKKIKKVDIQIVWWLSLLLITIFFHSQHFLDSDEGVILEGAWNLLNGKKLYFDFFEFITPGSFYLILWAWKIFGAAYWVAKLLSIIIIFFSAVGLYKISCKLIISPWNNLLPAIFILSSFPWPIINHNIFNLFFIVWAVYFFVLGLENNLAKNFVASGLLTAGAILFLQQKGLAVLLTLSFFLVILLIKEKKYLWLKLNLYYWLAALLPLLLLPLKWPPKLLYEDLILFPLLNYAAINILSFYLLSFFFFALFLEIWLLRKQGSLKIWLLFLLQFILLLTTIPRASYPHLALIIFPIYVMIPIIIEKVRISFLKILLFASLVWSSQFIIVIPSTAMFLNAPPFYSEKNQGFITYTYIKNHCTGKYLYAGPFLPGFYFETRKLNPSPYYILLTGLNNNEQFLEAKAALSQYKPACAVLNYAMVKKFNHNKNNPVDNYIADNYQLDFQEGGILIYKLIK